MLFVEHDLDLVFALADAVTVLHLGRVLLSGTPDEVRASEAVREAYLGAGRREELFTTMTFLEVRGLVSGYDRSTCCTASTSTWPRAPCSGCSAATASASRR